MRAEASPVIATIGARQVDSSEVAPIEWYIRGPVESPEVVIAVNGIDPLHGVDSIGTTAAALTTEASIKRWKPDLVISAGAAGGFVSRGGFIGQVVLAHGPIIHHDRRIDLGGFKAYGRGEYPTADLSSIATELDITAGPCSSGDSLDAPPLDLAAMQSHGTLAKDMEAAAVAGVAARSSVPFSAVKAITDLVDETQATAEQFVANLEMATRALAVAVPQILDAVQRSQPGKVVHQ